MWKEEEVKLLESKGFRKNRGTEAYRRYFNHGFAKLPNEIHKTEEGYVVGRWRKTKFRIEKFAEFKAAMEFLNG